MKTTYIVTLIALGLCAESKGGSLSTVDGTTYNNITEQRVDPDGLYIQYSLPAGGLGMSKIKFSRLSADQQKQFGYNAEKARNYEAQVAKANEDFRQECIRRQEAVQAQEADQRKHADQEERVANDRIIALAQLKEAEADLARTTGNNGGYGYYDGDGLFAIPQVGRRITPRTDYAPVVPPIPFPSRTTPRSR